MIEPEFIAALRALPLHRGARSLADDAAVVGEFVVTTDTLVEGQHFLPTDPAGDVAWKLVATNLSDLAAKGATPAGITLNYPLSDDAWDRAFLAGLAATLAVLDCPLIGGDTVTLPAGAPRILSVTAFGKDAPTPPRRRAREGDALFVTGTIGDAGAGLAIAKGAAGPDALLVAYRRPRPRLADGRALAPVVHAMMDVSDGLLIDAARMASVSGLSVSIDLASVPLSDAYRAHRGEDRAARMAAATAGDDYQLLFAGPLDRRWPVPATLIGTFAAGRGLSMGDAGEKVAIPETLGWQHGA